MTDSDGDGVPDACDPEPMDQMTPDHAVMYHFPTDITEFTVAGTDVVHNVNSIEIGNEANTENDSLITNAAWQRAYVEVGFQIFDVGTGLPDKNYEELEVFTGLGSTMAELRGFGCTIERQYQDNTNVKVIVENSSGGPINEVSDAVPLEQSVGVIRVIQTDTIDCTVSRTSNGTPSMLGVAGGTGTIANHVGVYATQLRAEISYIFIAGVSK
ncbi:MAG: hypothetical protein QM831_41295 [Kofleriaceae bacterium]